MMPQEAWLLTILFIFSFTLCGAILGEAQKPPLPNGIKISPTSPDLPKELVAFWGKWSAVRDSGLISVLVVEQIQEAWAQVIYSVGDSPRLDVLLLLPS